MTVDEIKFVLCRTQKKSAHNPDTNRYEGIDMLSDNELEERAVIYNSSIESAIIINKE